MTPAELVGAFITDRGVISASTPGGFAHELAAKLHTVMD